MPEDSPAQLLIPVTESHPQRPTVQFAVDHVRSAEVDDPTIHFVYVRDSHEVETGSMALEQSIDHRLDRCRSWATEESRAVAIETAIIASDEYLFRPDDYARVLATYAAQYDLTQVMVESGFAPGGRAPILHPFTTELERRDLDVIEAPITGETRFGILHDRLDLWKYGLVFGASLGFYLALGGFDGYWTIMTGTISSLIVAFLLARISVKFGPDPVRMAMQLARFSLFVPYLLWEIVKANISLAYVILNPRLPIEPRIVEFDAAVRDDFPVTTLANSITLTPGTLTINVSDGEFRIHTLTRSSRADLLGGGLERAVRFVFHGRQAARIPSPAERDYRVTAGMPTTISGGEDDSA